MSMRVFRGALREGNDNTYSAFSWYGFLLRCSNLLMSAILIDLLPIWTVDAKDTNLLLLLRK